MAQLYPFKKITNKPTIINPVDYPHTRTERQAEALRLAWEPSATTTPATRVSSGGGSGGKRVAGSLALNGGTV